MNRTLPFERQKRVIILNLTFCSGGKKKSKVEKSNLQPNPDLSCRPCRYVTECQISLNSQILKGEVYLITVTASHEYENRGCLQLKFEQWETQVYHGRNNKKRNNDADFLHRLSYYKNDLKEGITYISRSLLVRLLHGLRRSENGHF